MCRRDDYPPYDDPPLRSPERDVAVINQLDALGIRFGHVHQPSRFSPDRCRHCAAKIEEASNGERDNGRG